MDTQLVEEVSCAMQEEATMPPCHTGGSPDSTHLSLSTFSVQDREERLLQEDGAELLEEEVEEAEEEEPYVPPVAAAARTADELRAAIVAGTQHIVIKNHLDLTNLEAVDDEFGNIITLPIVPKTVQSITVRSTALLFWVGKFGYVCAVGIAVVDGACENSMHS